MTRAVEADVVVVGAGLAGLAAARQVAAAGREVVVLEARDRVGGRTLTREVGDGLLLDLGAQWIGPGQDRMAALAREAGIETFRQHTAGANQISLDGRLKRYEGTVPRLNPLVLLDTERLRRKLGRLVGTVDPDAPWDAPDAARLDAQTFATWLERNARTRTTRRIVGLAGKTVWGMEPEDASLLHVLHYTAAAGSFDMLVDTEGGAQQDRFVGGTQLLALRIAEGLGGGVVTNAPVRRIEHGDGRVQVHAEGASATARRAVIAIPPPLAGRIAYDPPMPPSRDQLTQCTPQGAIAKCFGVYDEPFWRDDGLSGEALTDAGPVTLTFDASPASGRPGVLLGFVGGRDARAFATTDSEERRGLALKVFEQLFGARAARPEHYVDHSWTNDPWSAGGPNAHLPPGAWTSYGRALRDPVGSLHWAGTDAATRWCGFMEGAVRSGERAAAGALAALRED